MKPRLLCLTVLVLLFSRVVASAKYNLIETERVPIGRLLTNLQQRLATNSQNIELLYRLARVHSMAYATNLSTFEVTKKEREPVFGYPGSDTGVPHVIAARKTAQEQVVARQHLTNAISYYQRAAKLVMKGTNAPAHRWLVVPIHLGLAWCIDQAGRRDDAIEAYRDALHLAWRQEVSGEMTFTERAHWSWDRLREGKNPFAKPPSSQGYLGPGVCYSEEIIGYLLKLLDPKKDAKEIAQLEADRKTLRSMPRLITPILVSLHPGRALDSLVDPNACVPFDLDGSGELRRWGWITTNAAWLVFDHNGQGSITSGLQMFGNVTFWVFWRNGYDALASLDDNGDGQLSSEELHGVALWEDRNGNGVSEPGEVTPVSELGIVSINCRSAVHSSGIPFSGRGVVFRDGNTRSTYDWIAPSH